MDLRSEKKVCQMDRQPELRNDCIAMLRSHPDIKYVKRRKTALPIEEGIMFQSAKDDTEQWAL